MWFSITKKNTMPVIKVYLHFVWTTKNRIPYLPTLEIRNLMWDHIALNAKKKGIFLLCVNGYDDHCHCLVSMCKDQTLSKIAQLIKGESSYWINKSGLIRSYFPNKDFDWQDEYYVESVSPRSVRAVLNYIHSQEEHHKVITFKEEYDKFLKEFEG